MTVGIQFEEAAAPTDLAHNRMDVGCFVGFVRARSQALPATLREWFLEHGFIDAPGTRPRTEIESLLHVPVPVSSFAAFDALFDWENETDGTTYLGAAVRSFFAQGGRKCFVVRVGEPLALDALRAARLSAVLELVPASSSSPALAPYDRAAWRGIGHLHGLPDACLLCLPDLPALVAQVVEPEEPEPEPTPRREFFVECSEPALALPDTPPPSLFRAPRLLDESGYRDWAVQIHRVADFLHRFRRDVQLIAAVPIPGEGTEASIDVLNVFVRAGLLESVESGELAGLSSAHVQLAYPWLGLAAANGVPEQLEPPDGVLAGLIARNTLLHGAFASAAGQELRNVFKLYPKLSLAQRSRPHPPSRPTQLPRYALQERFSLLGRTVDGFRLLSDVTTSVDEGWRPANSNRLMSIWVRALRHVSERLVFEASNEAMWAHIRSLLGFIGSSLFRQGALRGQNAEEAFQVRCDRSTMTRSDLDNGRVVAEVTYRPAPPIEGISVAFALQESQPVSVRQKAVAV